MRDSSRDDIVNYLARERDRMMEADEKRIQRMLRASAGYQDTFAALKRSWKHQGTALAKQHVDLLPPGRSWKRTFMVDSDRIRAASSRTFERY